jgi:hypothetical protein
VKDNELMVNKIEGLPPHLKNKNIFERHPKKTIILSIIIFFFLVEVTGHFIYYFTHDRYFVFNKVDFVKFTPYGLVEYKANATIRLPGFPAPLETDQYGFVHNGYKRAIGPDEYLIFIVGGSTVEGRGASSNATTIAAYLEKMLNRQSGKTRFRVVNAAVCGFMSYEELSFIDGKILQNFQPQMIIAVDGRNDGHYAVSHQEWKVNWMPYYDQITADVNKNMEPGLGILVDLVKRYSIIAACFGKIRENIVHMNKNDYSQETIPSNERIAVAAKAYVVNHQVIHERLKLYGIQYYFFLQPTLATLPPANFLPTAGSLGGFFHRDWPLPGIVQRSWGASRALRFQLARPRRFLPNSRVGLHSQRIKQVALFQLFAKRGDISIAGVRHDDPLCQSPAACLVDHL